MKKKTTNSHWLPESWLKPSPSAGGKAAEWHICRDCLLPLAEFFDRLVDGWDAGDQTIARKARPRLSTVQFTGSQIRAALNFLENRWDKPTFSYAEGTKQGDGKVVESIERCDLGFAHTWLAANVSCDFARMFRRIVRKPNRTVRRDDEWWRERSKKIRKGEPVDPEFVAANIRQQHAAALWTDLVRAANFLRRAAIVVEERLTNALPKVGPVTPGGGTPEWSMPDYPSRWAKQFGMKLAAFNRMTEAGKIRIKRMSPRKISVHVADLPAPRDRATK